MSAQISRRTVLRGVGTALALPWLEAMGPMAAWADNAAPNRAPNRMAFLYVPNGIHMSQWTPAAEGASYELPAILEPLSDLRSEFNILTGLTADKARPNGDGAGDHARAMAAFLTGAQPRKTDGADIRAGVSVDQVAAARVGSQTRLSSLEIGCDPNAMAGNCDSGYSCAYSSTISWRSASTPLPKLTSPRQVFDRLFGSDSEADRARREQTRRSIIDYVLEDAGSLQSTLGASDRRKLEEYFTAIRDIEERIRRAASLPRVATPTYNVPASVPASYQEHIRILCDLLVLAFQTDTTRVSTFVFANEGSNKSYPFLNVREGHHDLSHHENNPAKQAKIAQINRFHIQQLGYLLGKLKSVREGDGTLLDHSMVVYGSGNSDGNAHNHDNLPILQAGKAGASIRTGRHIRYARNTPLNNLWLSMLDRMASGVDVLGGQHGAVGGIEWIALGPVAWQPVLVWRRRGIVMVVADEIIAERIYGVVHCGLSCKPARSLPELAREFGLADNESNYREIDAAAAKRVIQGILHQDMAYNAEVMPAIRAAELADLFLTQFGTEEVRYYTNGNFHQVQGPMGWNPVTAATFDTGILVIGLQNSGCIWVEDED